MAETGGIRRWCREWWITLRYGSRLTRAGRALRRNMRDDLSEYVEVEPPIWCAEHMEPYCPRGHVIPPEGGDR